ncbi:sensor histidine kinase [Tenacibaculum jejuense]|uniref:Signal transduction histidine kinase LytS n=1 Tax=Tenacibaculum jejuense TaxID=584609 RepID=A0A238UCU2_9FLAO|nr:histidine kinase [Tenacibaculum jejuense]SNR16991.1 Signal transduction histidine kinase LytS [Tenacibaculum jejuense]
MVDFFEKIANYIKSNRVVKHLIFWSVFTIFNLIRDIAAGSHRGEKYPIYEELIPLTSIISDIPAIITSYLVVYICFEKFIKKQKYVLGILLFIVIIYIMANLYRLYNIHIIEGVYRVPPFHKESLLEIIKTPRYLIPNYIPSLVYISFIFTAVKYHFESEEKRRNQLEIDKEKVDLELKTLKGQLNPHFLFNTLNNIYSLSILNSPHTSNAIAKLSEMLDFVLFKSDDELVSLENEISLIENYITLEKLRYNEDLQISFTKDIQASNTIPPLVLLSLVENAFKHGEKSNSTAPEIHIDLQSTEDQLTFKISNSITNSEKVKTRKPLGLVNIKKQLSLIYGSQYSLEISNEPSKLLFTVTLIIKK